MRWLCLCAVFVSWGPAVLADEDGRDCSTDRLAGLLDEADVVDRIKDCLARVQDKGPLQVLLGAAYLRAGNDFWAIKHLAARVAKEPGDCRARALLAWAYLRQAALDQAMDALGDSGTCSGPDAARLAMIRAMVLGNLGDGQGAAAAVAEAMSQDTAYRADLAALPAVKQAAAPVVMQDAAWRVDVQAGWTSNALMGSPTDLGAASGASSAIFRTDAWLRLAPRTGTWLRPSIELQPRVVRFLGDARDFSFFEATGRLGVYLNSESMPRLLLAWRPDMLLLDMGDRYSPGPVWYFEGHRGEFELEATPWLLVFGGGGRVTFRDQARTRTEADLGVGGTWRPLALLTVMPAVSGRMHRAGSSAYHLWGASFLLSVGARLPAGLVARAVLSASGDWYPDSAGYQAFGPVAKDRRDLQARVKASAWSPQWHGIRLGVSYEYTTRDSTVPMFAFDDHRITARIALTGGADLFMPDPVPGPAAAPLDWGLGEGGGGLGDRVQDMLRMDETVQRSSSCVQ